MTFARSVLTPLLRRAPMNAHAPLTHASPTPQSAQPLFSPVPTCLKGPTDMQIFVLQTRTAPLLLKPSLMDRPAQRRVGSPNTPGRSNCTPNCRPSIFPVPTAGLSLQPSTSLTCTGQRNSSSAQTPSKCRLKRCRTLRPVLVPRDPKHHTQ